MTELSGVTVGVISLLIFLFFMAGGINCAFSMLIGGSVGLFLLRDPLIAGQLISAEFFNTFASYTLSVGPLFGLMGMMASYSGVAAKLFNCLNTFIGHRKIGIPTTVQFACVGFGAICGSSPACLATMTTVAYPEMRKIGYSSEIAAMCLLAGGTLSAIIPPSTPMIIYGLASETNLTHLFMAGYVPGFLLLIVTIITILIVSKIHPDWVPSISGIKHSWAVRIKSMKNGGIIEIAIVFVVAMVGMFAGFFTPTEAGAVGAFGMFVVTVVSRQLNMKKFIGALYAGVKLQALIYMLLACANVFAKMFSVTRIPSMIGSWVSSLDMSPYIILTIILLIYFAIGLITDLVPMMLITIPIFYPLVVDYCGYSPLWFGIVMVLVMAVANITPPTGTSIFLEKGLISKFEPEVTIIQLYKAITPWVVNKIIMIIILIIFPGIVDWLPNLIYGLA